MQVRAEEYEGSDERLWTGERKSMPLYSFPLVIRFVWQVEEGEEEADEDKDEFSDAK